MCTLWLSSTKPKRTLDKAVGGVSIGKEIETVEEGGALPLCLLRVLRKDWLDEEQWRDR